MKNTKCDECGSRNGHTECDKSQRVPMSAVQLEVERILANVTDLPIGKSLLLADIAHDGFGGVTVKRNSRYTVVFQRQFSRERSRWADNIQQVYEEIEAYVQTGKLREPDQIIGF
jgi:hypothetical protein